MPNPRPKTPGRVTPLDQKKQQGRPRKEPPPDAAQVILHACATGANKTGVAIALGASEDVLVRWLDEHPELKQAFTQGRERERQTLHTVLYDSAIANNGRDSLIAAMFLLKARHGYVEGQQEAQANRVNVTFNIPAAQPLNQFMVIDNEPTRTESVSTKLASLTRGT